ncbi:MAG: nucleotidyltransferase family protein [Gemmatimonadaceae bacterium]|nr:nucleotidyltransferase family protein [Gemmatimonadaceae bacterium]
MREEFALRSMGDLDLLVPGAQHAAARTALRAVGWTDGAAPESYANHHHEAPMLRPGGIRLELHSGLFPPGHPFAADSAEAGRSRSGEREWGGRRVQVLPAPWHLVHASVHWAWSPQRGWKSAVPGKTCPARRAPADGGVAARR